ncbi:clostripain-related cysteine peptidase [Fimbriimonas ginsengisoli]|uniref:Putative clostripain peptidase family n=1 Tax=Fimbriimonas ginsengisoli Gsoil 348 TaxID=661478 RepID=A0A068NYQ5_FIMGI|nr:clostripain-related cysteine peptidase [Fimbriimonas ginsengisoli]AIE87234.1 putative clostripain peptidase family [Fimbriimonas ginsengisoli Gsoil 348]
MICVRRSLIALCALTLALSGCGGGGGGGGRGPDNTGVLVNTNWNGGVGGAAGQSERVSILSPTGTVLSQKVVNRAATTSTTSLTAPATGYTVRVELNSAANFGGSVIGILEDTVVSGSSVLNVAVGAPVQSIRILPGTADISIGGKLRLGIAGLDSGGNLTFVNAGSVTFSKTGTSADVDANGTVTGVSSGTTTVRATYTPGALSASSTINVQKAGVTKSKWTVMVFLNAANNLYPYAIPNVNQMEKVAGNADVRFVLQWKETGAIFGQENVHHDGTRRYLVKPDNTATIKSQLIQDLGTNVDMGSAATLRDFVAWSKENYPADRYVLIVWNHGNGWQRSKIVGPPVRAVSYDDQFNSFIDIWDLPGALAGQKVDILSFDACLMQMLEIASDVKGSCDYIATSEENTPGPGYPYDRIFSTFANSPDLSTRQLSKAFVDGHVTLDAYKNLPVTQSVIDTSKVAAVEVAIDNLAGALIANQATIAGVIPTIRNNAPKYADPGDGHDYYDLVDLCQRLKANPTITADIKSAADGVIAAVGTPDSNNAVVWEGHTSLSSFSHGLSIDFSPSTLDQLRYYSNLNLAKVTRWDDWLRIAP